MASQTNPRTITLPAAADLSAKQYFFVQLSSGKAALASTAQLGVGVLQNKPAAADDAASVAELVGVLKVVAGAAVAQDAPITNDTTGRAVTATSGEEQKGFALDAATAAGQVIRMLCHVREVD